MFCYMSRFKNNILENPCNFPHKLSQHPNNVVLLRKYHYNILNEDLLCHLLHLHYSIKNKQVRVRYIIYFILFIVKIIISGST